MTTFDPDEFVLTPEEVEALEIMMSEEIDPELIDEPIWK